MSYSASAPGSTRSGCVFDLPSLESEINQLSEQSQQPGFWDDNRAAQVVMRRLTSLQDQVDRWRGMSSRASDLEELLQLAVEENDEDDAGRGIARRHPPAARARYPGTNPHAQRPARRQQRHPVGACSRGRHRSAGLGADAHAHVPALGRGPQVRHRNPRYDGRGRSGHQERDHPDEGAERLRLRPRRSAALTAWCACRLSTRRTGGTPPSPWWRCCPNWRTRARW